MQKGKSYNGHAGKGRGKGDGGGGPAKGKGGVAKGGGKGGKGKGKGGGAKGRALPRDASGCIRAIAVEADPEERVRLLLAGAGVISAGLPTLSLADLEKLVEALWSSRQAFRFDRLEDAMQALAPALMPALAQKFVRQIQAHSQLDRVLEVLLSLAEAEPDSAVILQVGSVQAVFEQALGRCSSGASRQLWTQLQAACAGDPHVLRRVVHRRAREAAGAAEALPDLAGIEPLPTIAELLEGSQRLPYNREGAWAAADEEPYRQTHYLLYRAELLSPLREAVASFLDSKGLASPAIAQLARGPHGQPGNFIAYEDVYAVQIAVSKSNQPMVQLKFGMANRRVDFTLGSHLIYGSLVILFEVDGQNRPNTESALYATVEDFDLRTAAYQHIVGVCILSEDGWGRFSMSKKYVMVESPGYYHAVRPVLDWLKDPAHLRELTLKTALLTGERQHHRGGNQRGVNFLRGARVDLSCLYKRELVRQGPREQWKNRDPLAVWPDSQDIELDPSQQVSMHHILGCAVPLVQGPPGTGKSYIGIKAVQIIRQALDCKGFSEPIVLICLTNHALDQFLEDLLDIFPNKIIRFGGRTKSEDHRLLECLVHLHMPRPSPQNYKERKDIERRLHSKVEDMERLRRFCSNRAGQIRLLLASMHHRTLERILAGLDEDSLEAGLFLGDPLRFTTDVLWWWVDGESLGTVHAKVKYEPPVEQNATLELSNTFAALDEDGPDVDDFRVLSDLDRKVAKHLPALARNLGQDLEMDGYLSNSEDDEELDDDEVEAVLDDRLEAGWSRGGSGRRAARQETTVSAPEGPNPVLLRGEAFTEAETWERDAQAAQRQLAETEAEADEAGVQGRTRAQMLRPLVNKLARFRREAEARRARWRQAKQECRSTVVKWLCMKQLERLTSAIPNAEHLRALPSRDFDWRTSKAQRKAVLQQVVYAASDAAREIFQKGFQKALWPVSRPEGMDRCSGGQGVIPGLVGAHDGRRPCQQLRSWRNQAHRDGEILAQLKKMSQLAACQRAAVVGMTSTFAALNRDLLQRMGSRVVVVEEAGELLECQLMACLSSPNLEQVILIGDHQQLRPKVNTYDLCRKHHLDISLFERLIKSGCTRAQLTTQLRMQPDVSDLVRPFYTRIEDHERVKHYPPVPGVADTLFWITHDHKEDNIAKAVSLSKYNSHEAKFACRFAQHLVLNGMDKSRITILTPYLGQKREIKKHVPPELQNTWISAVDAVDEQAEEDGDDDNGKGKGKRARKGKGKGKGKVMPKGKGKGKVDNGRRLAPGVRVVTIDDYQGEENDVIILSLVRNNPQMKLGFCSIENRIIVALSRARHGMYVLGNVDMFKGDDRWFKVLGKFQAKDRVGPKLNLRCRKHPQDEGLVSCVQDFDRVARHGGCHRKCDSMLPRCGHRCPLYCHPFDEEHRDVVCVGPCVRPRPEGCAHVCPKLCKDCPGETPGDVCPSPCQVKVEVTLPCSHQQEERCFKVQLPAQLTEITCRTEVRVDLSCGHHRKAACPVAAQHRSGEAPLQCTFKEKVHAACGHKVWKHCHNLQPCHQRCPKTIARCGHQCTRRCSEAHDHEHCQQPCPDFLHCGHKCQSLCGEAHTDHCAEACARVCTHGHRCPGKCGEVCVPCHEACSWRCPHFQCTRLCHELCDRPRCEEPCKRLLPCGHLCRGVCGEPCVKCVQCDITPGEKCPLSLETLAEIPGKLYQLECGHVFDLKMLDGYMATAQQSDGHAAIQAKCCPTCRHHVHQAPRYQKEVKEQLLLIDAVKKAQRRRRMQPLTDQERREVDRAMGQGFAGQTGAGHWFACPNGHPYFIGECGGAMQVSTCPECGARVGGGQHRLLEDNAFLPNFAGDGAAQPAWPGVWQRVMAAFG